MSPYSLLWFSAPIQPANDGHVYRFIRCYDELTEWVVFPRSVYLSAAYTFSTSALASRKSIGYDYTMLRLLAKYRLQNDYLCAKSVCAEELRMSCRDPQDRKFRILRGSASRWIIEMDLRTF